MKLLAIVALTLASAPLLNADSKDDADSKGGPGRVDSPRERQISELCDSMKRGKLLPQDVAKLNKEHIPLLLRHAGDKTLARSFPHNPLSSQSQAKCPVGIAVLWIVEGIRKGGDRFSYPSANPMCLKKGGAEDWEEQSIGNQPEAVVAYSKWWEVYSKTKALEDFQRDPLEGTGLHWY